MINSMAGLRRYLVCGSKFKIVRNDWKSSDPSIGMTMVVTYADRTRMAYRPAGSDSKCDATWFDWPVRSLVRFDETGFDLNLHGGFKLAMRFEYVAQLIAEGAESEK